MGDSGRRRGRLRAQEREIDGRRVWVLYDRIGVVQIADSREALRRHHPGASFDSASIHPEA